MSSNVKGILLREETLEALLALSDEQRGKLILALFSDTGMCEAPELDQTTHVAFLCIIPSVRRAQEDATRRYNSSIENGRKGGRPKKQLDTDDDNPENPRVFEKTDGFSEKTQKTKTNPIQSNPNETNQSQIKILTSSASADAERTQKAPQEEVLRGKKKTLRGKRAETFNRFWEAFAYKKDKAQAIDAWAAIPTLTDAIVDTICLAAEQVARQRPELTASGRTPIYAQGWLNGRRWEDEEETSEAEMGFKFV